MRASFCASLSRSSSMVRLAWVSVLVADFVGGARSLRFSNCPSFLGAVWGIRWICAGTS